VGDAESGEEILNQQVSTASAEAVAFSPDGSQLATAGADGKAKLWDLASGDELLTLTGHDEHVRRIEFTSDGKHLVSASSDYTMRVWVLDLEELIALGEARVTRAMTTEECQQYLHVDVCPVE